jgi:hypothetical protein
MPCHTSGGMTERSGHIQPAGTAEGGAEHRGWSPRVYHVVLCCSVGPSKLTLSLSLVRHMASFRTLETAQAPKFANALLKTSGTEEQWQSPDS